MKIRNPSLHFQNIQNPCSFLSLSQRNALLMHIKKQRKVIDLKLKVLDDKRVKDRVTEAVELDAMELLVDRKDLDVMQICQC